MFRGRVKRLHLVGIGGSGMSGIAHVLCAMGYDVRGSDLADSPTSLRLRAMGIRVFIGHDAGHLGDADVVVVSTAVGPHNPELVAARAQGVPVVPRAEMLAELMRLKYGIAVAGTHGKTTVTSLVAACLEEGGVDPTVIIGGRLKHLGANARLGGGDYLVAEADESDGSFLRLAPSIAVITNIDAEHLDHWQGGLTQLIAGFANFADKVPFYGALVACWDHPTVRALLPQVGRRQVTYGLTPGAHWQATGVAVTEAGMAFDVQHLGRSLGRAEVRLIGRHNVANALCALAVAAEVGVPFATSARALAKFAGIGRRFELKGCPRDIMVVDDYGHHPVEIVATLAAARAAFGRRLVVAFQPHRFSRTRDLMDDFVGAFDVCDRLFVADVYAAGERPIAGADGRALARAISQRGQIPCTYGGSLAAMLSQVAAELAPGDLFLTLGAGNINLLSDAMLAHLAPALDETGT